MVKLASHHVGGDGLEELHDGMLLGPKEVKFVEVLDEGDFVKCCAAAASDWPGLLLSGCRCSCQQHQRAKRASDSIFCSKSTWRKNKEREKPAGEKRQFQMRDIYFEFVSAC